MVNKVVAVALLALVAVNAGALGGLYYFTDFFDEPEAPNTDTTVSAVLELDFNVTDGKSLERDYFQATITTNESTVLGQLRSASKEYGFEVTTESYDFGILVTAIDGVASNDTYYWIYYLNWEIGTQGADAQPLADEDVVTWTYQKNPYE